MMRPSSSRKCTGMQLGVYHGIVQLYTVCDVRASSDRAANVRMLFRNRVQQFQVNNLPVQTAAPRSVERLQHETAYPSFHPPFSAGHDTLRENISQE